MGGGFERIGGPQRGQRPTARKRNAAAGAETRGRRGGMTLSRSDTARREPARGPTHGAFALLHFARSAPRQRRSIFSASSHRPCRSTERAVPGILEVLRETTRRLQAGSTRWAERGPRGTSNIPADVVRTAERGKGSGMDSVRTQGPRPEPASGTLSAARPSARSRSARAGTSEVASARAATPRLLRLPSRSSTERVSARTIPHRA